MTQIDVTIILVALTTLCTTILIGVGFLPFPGRAAAIWSSGFALVMASSYLLAAADQLDSSALRAAAHGPIFCSIGFVWVGLRARREREPILLVPTIVVYSLVTVALALTATTETYGLALRLAFLVAAVSSGLVGRELLRLRKSELEVSLPLMVAAFGFVGLAVLIGIDGISRAMRGLPGQTEQELQSVYALNELIAVVYLVCALVTLLALIRVRSAGGSPTKTLDFAAVARDRLERAKTADDRWWSIVDVRLDDPAELLEASSGRAFDRVTARFASDIREVMPPEADIHAVSPTQVLVLLPRPDTAVRALLSTLLERIATVTDQQAVPVRLSASIGVAAAPLADYDFDRLRIAAAEAAAHAQIAGGDRWERAVFAP